MPTASTTSEITISPRIATRDGLDIFLVAVIGGFQAFLLFGVPAIIAYFLTHSLIISTATFIAFYLGLLAFMVWSISATEHGIRFHRLLGGPRFISWSQITSVRESSRAETILEGWIWPLFPPRELTPCLSSTGHFRIDYEGRHIYYPPLDADLFRKIISERVTPPSSI